MLTINSLQQGAAVGTRCAYGGAMHSGAG